MVIPNREPTIPDPGIIVCKAASLAGTGFYLTPARKMLEFVRKE